MTDQLEKQKQDVADRIRFTSGLLDGADWALAAAQGINDAQQFPAYDPLTWAAKLGYGSLATLYYKFNGEPGFSDLDPNNVPDYEKAQISKIQEKKDYVDSTDYKYYISDFAMDYGPGIGPHMSFISELKKKTKELQNNIPENETQDEKETREAYIGYLHQIIDLNEKGDLSALNKKFNNIDSR